MGVEIDIATRFRARERYIYDGLTYDQVSEEFGISTTQLKHWSSEEAGRSGKSWAEKRRDHLANYATQRDNEIRAGLALIEKAADASDCNAVYGYVALQKLELARKAAEQSAVRAAALDVDVEPVNDPASAATALMQIVKAKIYRMLSGRDDIDMKKMAELDKALVLAEKMKAKHSEDTGEADEKILDAEEIKRLREQLL